MSDHDISPTWPGWLERARLLHWSEASTFTFVRGAGLDQVRAAFGVEPDSRVTPDEMAVGVKAVAIVPCGDGWLVLEDGFQGARPEVLRLTSSNGTAASMYWNVNMTNSLSLARDGAVVAFVDAMFPEDVIGDPPEDMRPWLQRLAAEPEALKPIGVMAAAALAGLPLLDLPDQDELEWLPVIPQLEDLHLEQVEYTSLRYDADELVRRVGSEPPATQHSIARETARALLTEVQLQAVSNVAALLEQLQISGPTPFDPAMRLLLDAHRECEVLARGYVSWTGAPPPACAGRGLGAEESPHRAALRLRAGRRVGRARGADLPRDVGPGRLAAPCIVAARRSRIGPLTDAQDRGSVRRAG